MNLKALQKKADKLEAKIGERVNCEILDMIYELIELELQIEAECNK